VKDTFGIVGSAFMDALDLFPLAGIRFISVQHEQNAAHMADGYARVSNKHGVCIAQNGPGISNFITGIQADANMTDASNTTTIGLSNNNTYTNTSAPSASPTISPSTDYPTISPSIAPSLNATTEEPDECAPCVEQFLMNGGCGTILPTGCEECREAATAGCGKICNGLTCQELIMDLMTPCSITFEQVCGAGFDAPGGLDPNTPLDVLCPGECQLGGIF